MRCLYCGKELALLKRWTSGGEFCSDAHRQQYQEEYNQLALKRLLQAKPEPKPKPPAEEKSTAPAAESKPQPAAEPVKALPALEPVKQVVARLPEPEPEPQLEPEPEPEPEPEKELEPVAETVEEDPAPAEAGFFIELPVPVASGGMTAAVAEADFARVHTPLLPGFESEPWASEPWGTELVAAGRISLAGNSRLADYAARVSEGKLEVRDFTRTAPVVEFDLDAAGSAEIAERSEEPMDILVFPQPPPGSPVLWNEGERSFLPATELGPLARMVFRTTGIEDNESGEIEFVAPPEVETAAEIQAPVEIETPAATVAPPRAVPQATPVRVVSEPARPAAQVIRPASTVATSFFRPAAKPPVHIPSESTPPVAASNGQNIPEPATKALPVTLHGLAAGRGKPVQVFPSAVSGGVDLQVPRSNALPLRPVMVLSAGPAVETVVAEKEVKEDRKSSTTVVKADTRKQNRPDPRFSNGKGRKPEPEPEPVKVEAEAKAIAVKEPEPEKVQPPAKTEPVKESLPAPFAKPYTPLDLDLPSLSLDAGGSFWSRLPVVGKIGLALALVLAIGGSVYALSRGGTAKTLNAAPRIVEGRALTAVESGWITDWGAEPGVRKEHDISVLRSSVNLTDYRLEFEAQIDTKALGWVYRAVDGKNYYVNKLEIMKPGLTPTVALVRFAVINGQEQPRMQAPLSLPLHLDTLYKVRFDAVGDHFTTYLQDQKVDEWTDDRLKTGGIGLYNERGERMSLKGTVNVVPLMIQK